MEQKIPMLTYGKSQKHNPPESYIKFCNKAITRYRIHGPATFEDRMDNVLDQYKDILFGVLKEKKQTDTEYSYDDTYDQESDESYIESDSDDDYY